MARKTQSRQERQPKKMAEHHDVELENLEQNVDQGNNGHNNGGQLMNNEPRQRMTNRDY